MGPMPKPSEEERKTVKAAKRKRNKAARRQREKLAADLACIAEQEEPESEQEVPEAASAAAATASESVPEAAAASEPEVASSSGGADDAEAAETLNAKIRRERRRAGDAKDSYEKAMYQLQVAEEKLQVTEGARWADNVKSEMEVRSLGLKNQEVLKDLGEAKSQLQALQQGLSSKDALIQELTEQNTKLQARLAMSERESAQVPALKQELASTKTELSSAKWDLQDQEIRQKAECLRPNERIAEETARGLGWKVGLG